ncbi:MAG: HEAT repeat domain-containing protein [Treponema sp.]|nr:HEAT repeat domain-containing protein [Treponema sp.]
MRQTLVLGLLCFPLLGLAAQSPSAAGEIEPIWREALGGAVLGPPSIQGETLAMVCDGGNLKTYTLQGSLLWDFFAQGRLSPFITRSPEGSSYICRTNGTLIAVNRVGRELWRRRLDAPISAPVILGWDGRLFIPSARGIVCYTAAGQRLWSRQLQRPLAFPPCLDKTGGLLAVLDTGELLTINPHGLIRSRPLQALPSLVLPLALSASQGRGEPGPAALLLYPNGAAEVLSFTPSGAQANYPAPALPPLGGVPAAAAIRGGMAAVTLKNGRIVLLSLAEQSIRWSAESGVTTGAGEALGMLFNEWGIYVFSKNAAAGFYEDGRRLWILEIRGAGALPALSDDGILYFGGIDWVLDAYRLEDRPLDRPRSPFGPGPEGSYRIGAENLASLPDYTFFFSEGAIKDQLALISQGVLAGQVGEREGPWAAYLLEVAENLKNDPNKTSPARSAAPLHRRKEALHLLGRLGSQELIPRLTAIYSQDPEPVIKAAAAEAIGRIGIDPQGIAIRAFTAHAALPSGQDEQVLRNTAAAAGSLCRFTGPPVTELGVPLLSSLASKNRPSLVQNQALAELASLLE